MRLASRVRVCGSLVRVCGSLVRVCGSLVRVCGSLERVCCSGGRAGFPLFSCVDTPLVLSSYYGHCNLRVNLFRCEILEIQESKN